MARSVIAYKQNIGDISVPFAGDGYKWVQFTISSASIPFSVTLEGAIGSGASAYMPLSTDFAPMQTYTDPGTYRVYNLPTLMRFRTALGTNVEIRMQQREDDPIPETPAAKLNDSLLLQSTGFLFAGTLSAWNRQGSTVAFAAGYRWAWTATGTVDGGTIIPAFGGGVWNREFIGPVFTEWFKLPGATDDQASVTAAMTYFNDIQFLPRTYIQTAPYPEPTNKRLRGVRSSSYINFPLDFQQVNPSYFNKVTIFQYAPGLHGSTFATNAGSRVSGASLEGICIRYGGNRDTTDRIFPTATAVDSSTIFQCKFENMEAFITCLATATGANVIIDSRIFQCGTFFEGPIVDFVFDNNTFTSNTLPIYSRGGGGYNRFTNNRFEYGTGAIKCYQSRDDHFADNHFDGHSGHALEFIESSAQIIGGTMWRNSRVTPGGHLSVRDSDVKVSGVRMTRGVVDGGVAQTPNYAGAAGAFTGAGVKPTPLYAFSIAGSGNLEVDSMNYNAYTDSMLNDFVGGSTVQVSIGDWHLPDASDLSSTEDMKSCSPYLVGPVRTFLHRDLTVRAFYVRLRKIDLFGYGATRSITNSSGAIGFNTMTAINYGGLVYETRGGQLYAASIPNGFGNNGIFGVGDIVYNTTVASGGYIGNVKTINGGGSADTWKGFGLIA